MAHFLYVFLDTFLFAYKGIRSPSGSDLSCLSQPGVHGVVVRGSFAVVALLVCIGHAELTVHVEPSEVFLEEQARLVVQSDRSIPTALELPEVDGVDWIAGPMTHYRQRSVNGKTSISGRSTFVFRVTKLGPITIPSFSVKVNDNELKTKPVTVTVRERRFDGPAGKTRELSELFYADVTLAGEKTGVGKLYVGQEVPLTIEAYCHSDLRPTFSYPQLRMDDVTYRDYAQVNPRAPKFLPAHAERRIIGGERFIVAPFRTRIVPLRPGNLKGKAIVICEIAVSDNSGSSQSPFGGGLFRDLFAKDQTVQRTLAVDIPSAPVVPLPPYKGTEGAFIGLIGEWELELTLSADTVAVGQPVSVKLEIAGQGSVDALSLPTLTFPGYRVYEPEIKRATNPQTSRATVTWALMPLRQDVRPPVFSFATFNPVQEDYVTRAFTPSLNVQPAMGPQDDSGAAEQPPIAAVPPLTDGLAPQEQASAIFYIKTSLGGYTKRPLWRNTVFPVGVLIVLASLVYGGVALAAAHRDRVYGNVSYRRRREALKKRRQVYRRLRASVPENRAEVVREEVVPYLSALLDMPPGSTAHAVADRIEDDDSELACMLRDADAGDFTPHHKASIDARRMCCQIARLSSLLSVLLLLSLCGALTFAQSTVEGSLPEKIFNEAVGAYDQGAYDEAARLFNELQTVDAENAVLLYNLGNCAYRQGDLPRAAAFYERARRLSPRDSDIIGNLNVVREKLGQPHLFTAQDPAQLITNVRDRLRPDEWLLLAAVGLFAGCSAAAWCRWRSRRQTAVGIAFSIVIGMCVLAYHTQMSSSYRPKGKGIIATHRAVVHQLPSAESKRADVAIQAGDLVHVTERRTEWYRIRRNGSEAWIRKQDVYLVW